MKHLDHLNAPPKFFEPIIAPLESFSTHQEVVPLTLGTTGLNSVVANSAKYASINFDTHNSLYTRLKEQYPNVIKVNCFCHVLNNFAKFGIKHLKYNTHGHILKIYFILKNSEKLRSFCGFTKNIVNFMTYCCLMVIFTVSQLSSISLRCDEF